MANATTAPIVVVGGGLAAGTVVTELREGGYDGPLAVYTDEAHPPYERPPLSKDFLLDKGPLTAALVHPEDWYAEHRVDLHTSTPVTAIDPAHHQLTAAGATSSYSRSCWPPAPVRVTCPWPTTAAPRCTTCGSGTTPSGSARP